MQIIFSIGLICCFLSQIIFILGKVILLEVPDERQWDGWNKNTDEYNGWKLQNSISSSQSLTYSVCSVDQENVDYWLRSPYIERREGVSLHIEVNFTMRACSKYPNPQKLKQCKETFGIMYLQSDGPNELMASNYNSGYYLASTIAPDIKWTDITPETSINSIFNFKTAQIDVNKQGFYLAFRDQGSCVALYQVRVFYRVCSENIDNFAVYPRTPAPQGFKYTYVAVQCVSGAVLTTNNVPQFLCAADGGWVPQNPQFCECKAGYKSIGKTQCVACPPNWYKSASGSGSCIECPAHSTSGPAANQCVCQEGFYRSAADSIFSVCTEPPAAPVSLVAGSVESHEVTLEWDWIGPTSTLSSMDGRADLFFKVECDYCPMTTRFLPGAQLTSRNVTVMGLDSNTQYIFYVYALNGVSAIAKAERKSFTRLRVTTKPSMPAQISQVFVRVINKNVVLINWTLSSSSSDNNSPPILAYQVLVISRHNDSEQRQLYNVEKAEIRLPNLLPMTDYLVQVKSKNAFGWGDFSPVVVVNTSSPHNNQPHNHQHNSPASPITSDVQRNEADAIPIPIIVGTICAILVCLGVVIVLAVLVLRRNFYLQLFRAKIEEKMLTGDTSMTPPYNTAHSQVYFQRAAANVLHYIDPLTYEDPGLAVQEFTKELDAAWIRIDSVLDGGEFGDVCLGQLQRPGETASRSVAIKTLKHGASEKSRLDFLTEASIMGQFDHPNVVRLEGVVTRSNPVMIITPFMQNGALDAFLRDHDDGQLSAQQLVGMLLDIASGMNYLADMRFVHRDLAARNILVDSDLLCKVSDFGLSREVEADSSDSGAYTTKGGKIPVRWTAPEAIAYRKFTTLSDVWSFGVVVWEVTAYGERPYWNWSNPDVIAAVENGYRLPRPLNCPHALYQLALDCWSRDRLDRPRFDHIRHRLQEMKGVSKIVRESQQFNGGTSFHGNGSSSLTSLSLCAANVDPNALALVMRGSVANWLAHLKMEMYTNHFRRHGVHNMERVIQLTLDDLWSMDITSVGHQKKLLSNIYALRQHLIAAHMTADGSHV